MLANISISVPALPDNDDWFVNRQAWTNYWRDVTAAVTFVPVEVEQYVEAAFDATLEPCIQNIDGTDFVLVTKAMFDSLRNRIDTLNQDYIDFRTQLETQGLIEQVVP